ncbi:MEF2-activating motif and SAP domain-containing transcriptional regulator isoform X1 [Felis catus]|uniref:MEF2-activating motif and SAP domain-containing transcriptional regulator isoform X1 n=1 Tax=Felis catus TaxID=9685 RepID=UPI0003F1B83C|nr:MEF2-activating motif and SAP domain-containing transcriptional regulator isoform X1 [Felis catus]
MTLAASSQRSQIIRSKFRSVLQLRIHRRYQDPKTRSAGCPSRTPESCDSQPSHPLVTKDAIPAFLENIQVWLPRTSALQAPGVSLLGPALSRPRWGAVACRTLLPTQPCSSLPGLLSAGVSGSLTTSSVLDPDPWVSATGPALAPASPSGPTPFLFSPGDLLPESEYGPWRSLKESPKISQHWREPKPKGNLTYHQYMPPGPRQGSRVDPQAKMLALGPPGPPLWEGTDSQRPPPRMKPIPLTPSPPGVPSASPSPHKLELQTLKLEELTVSELRQQLRLRGLPVSGTKSMLLERMRGGALPRERPKPRREDSPASAPWPRLRPKALGAVRRPGSLKSGRSCHPPPLPRAAETQPTAPAPARAPALTPASAPSTAAPSLEEELQEAIRRAQLLPNRGIDDILEDQMESDDQLPPIPLDFPGSFDVLSPSPDSEGLSSVFSSSLPSPTNSPSPSPRGPTDSLDWLEALSGGPLLGCGPPAPSVFSADLSDPSGTRLWDLLDDPW